MLVPPYDIIFSVLRHLEVVRDSIHKSYEVSPSLVITRVLKVLQSYSTHSFSMVVAEEASSICLVVEAVVELSSSHWRDLVQSS